jgi:hypothetical protein
MKQLLHVMVHYGCQITFARLVAPLLLIKRLSFDAAPFLSLVLSAMVPHNMISTNHQLQWYFILEHQPAILFKRDPALLGVDLCPCNNARFICLGALATNISVAHQF